MPPSFRTFLNFNNLLGCLLQPLRNLWHAPSTLPFVHHITLCLAKLPLKGGTGLNTSISVGYMFSTMLYWDDRYLNKTNNYSNMKFSVMWYFMSLWWFCWWHYLWWTSLQVLSFQFALRASKCPNKSVMNCCHAWLKFGWKIIYKVIVMSTP